MKNHLQALAHRGANQLHTIATTINTTAVRLWRAHLATLEQSPVYETLLLALIELALGRRLDLHELLMRIMNRLRRNQPHLPEPDSWAY